jgi:hypothetical protein
MPYKPDSESPQLGGISISYAGPNVRKGALTTAAASSLRLAGGPGAGEAVLFFGL